MWQWARYPQALIMLPSCLRLAIWLTHTVSTELIHFMQIMERYTMYPYPVLVIQSPFHHKSVNISNMKLILLLSFFYAGAASAQTGLYDQQVQSLDGSTLNIGDYKTKKIMVASYSIADLQSGGLAYLDSLQQAYPSVVIIAIPAVDFSDSQNVASLDSLKNNLGTHII